VAAPVAVAVALAAAGCGASEQSREFASTVCGEIDAWVDAVNSSLDVLSGSVSERTTVEQELQAVGRHLDDVDAATEELMAAIQDVSTSEVDGAEALSARLLTLLERTDEVTEEVRQEVRGLEDQGLKEFRETVGPLLGQRIGGSVRQLLAAPTDPSAGEIAESFREEPACDGVLSPADQGSDLGT
jgi:uncharacterized protein YggL (DUF469 family)